MAALPTLLSPIELLHLSDGEADNLLDRLERTVPVHPPLLELTQPAAGEAIVLGDTHGDWRSTEAAMDRARVDGRLLIGLGDYVDRPPDDCGEGSVANALYLLQLAAADPRRVFLVQGNHETTRRIPVLPHHLPSEVDELWGPDSTRYDRLLGLLERGPLAMTTTNGVYLAHAGFPTGTLPQPWTEAYSSANEERLAEIVWSECDVSRVRRGASRPWGRRELDAFLGQTGLHVFLRGHDPDLTGRPLFEGRVLTLHTSRIYERYGGVIVARVPLETEVRSVADLVIEHLPTEGRSYPPPE